MNRLRAERQLHVTRRTFFEHAFGAAAGFSLGSVALASLFEEHGYAQSATSQPFLTHPAKVKRVVYLQMAGGPPTIDMFDYKPLLQKSDDMDAPESLYKGDVLRFRLIRDPKNWPKMGASPFSFKQYGQSGAWFSELLPHTATHADEITFLKGMETTQFNHGQAQTFQTTGFQIAGRASFGAWLSYGIGSESKDLPAYVVLLSGRGNPDGGSPCWGSGFLPTVHQGVPFRRQGDPINFVSNPNGITAETRRHSIDLINELNDAHLEHEGDPEIETRIAQYELAYRMQTSAPELTDFSNESQKTLEAYGATPGEASFANNALLARRLLERGVRFVQLIHRGWDAHGGSLAFDLVNMTRNACRAIDQPTSALMTDLKERGLLDDTLIIWAGEFGRTPTKQGMFSGNTKYLGRDHNPKGYTVWMSGGGLKHGVTYGSTDEWGFQVAEGKTMTHDVHATALHLLGIDDRKLTYRYQGRQFRLTGVGEDGQVIKAILA